MKTLKFLKLFLTSRHFRVTLRRMLEYAAASHNVQYGIGAADVLIFMGHYGEDVFDDKFRLETSRMRESIELMEKDRVKDSRAIWTKGCQKYWADKGVELPN